jgi:hypothetical protein
MEINFSSARSNWWSKRVAIRKSAYCRCDARTLDVYKLLQNIDIYAQMFSALWIESGSVAQPIHFEGLFMLQLMICN